MMSRYSIGCKLIGGEDSYAVDEMFDYEFASIRLTNRKIEIVVIDKSEDVNKRYGCRIIGKDNDLLFWLSSEDLDLMEIIEIGGAILSEGEYNVGDKFVAGPKSTTGAMFWEELKGTKSIEGEVVEIVYMDNDDTYGAFISGIRNNGGAKNMFWFNKDDFAKMVRIS